MHFANKRILIISPERWGINMLSKHHYAVALAKKNQIYFLNPPSATNEITLSESEYENITIVNYSQRFMGLNRLISLGPIFNFLSLLEISRLLNKLPNSLDVIWSFDPFRFQNLKLFKAPLAIFQCVDFVHTKLDLIAAKTADLVIAVAQPILDKYKTLNRQTYFINHGVSNYYLDAQRKIKKPDQKIRCGYVGNLLSFGIDHESLLTILVQNPMIEFHFIGPSTSSNLGNFIPQEIFINQLKRLSNVVLHGQMVPSEVSNQIQTYDLFLICYHTEAMGPIVSNSHKLLEFLSTGKVVVSSRISTYDKLAPPLFEMVSLREDLPKRFTEVINNLTHYNSTAFQEKRVDFAITNSYENHIREIELLTQSQ